MSNSRELSQSTVAFLRWITSATSHRWDSRRRTWCVSSMSISFEVVTGKRGWLVFKFEQFKNGIVRGRTIRFDYFVICDRLGACVGRPAGRFSCQHRRRHRTKAGKQGVKKERERERERGRTGKKKEVDFFCFVPFFTVLIDHRPWIVAFHTTVARLLDASPNGSNGRFFSFLMPWSTVPLLAY